jgi:hypothetical protein
MRQIPFLVAVLGLACASGTASALTRPVTWLTGPAYESTIYNGGGMTLNAATPDLRRVVFETPMTLTRGDRDGGRDDVYRSANGKLTLVSIGPRRELYNVTPNAEFEAASGDGRRVAWTTDEDLTADDDDYDNDAVPTAPDIYVRDADGTRLVSTGPRAGRGEYNGAGDFSARFGGASGNLERIFFSTSEQLVSADSDHLSDTYFREDGRTTVVTRSTEKGASPLAVARDGRRAFLLSAHRLAKSDHDDEWDMFEWSEGRFRQVTIGASGGNGPVSHGDENGDLAASSRDGKRAVFHTEERLTANDRDDRMDLYEWVDGRTRLLSTGPSGGNGPYDVGTPRDAELGVERGRFLGASADARRVVFSTAERLTAADRDSTFDVYLREDGRITLLSPRGRGGTGELGVRSAHASTSGRRIVLVTYERLTADDRDRSVDIYRWQDGRVERLTHGPRGGNRDEPFEILHGVPVRPTDAFVTYVSHDGSRIMFNTEERLVKGDRHAGRTIYERGPEGTSIVRFRRGDGKVRPAAIAGSVAATHDADDFVVDTTSPLVRGDRNDYSDLYLARRPR